MKKNYCNISRTTPATSEKRLLQQKNTIATFQIICCNIEKESL
jgi:hypothetical protein